MAPSPTTRCFPISASTPSRCPRTQRTRTITVCRSTSTRRSRKTSRCRLSTRSPRRGIRSTRAAAPATCKAFRIHTTAPTTTGLARWTAGFRKTGGGDGNRISSRQQVADVILAGGGRFGGGFDAGGIVLSDDRRVRYGRAAGIVNRARQVAADGLGKAAEASSQGQHNQSDKPQVLAFHSFGTSVKFP